MKQFKNIAVNQANIVNRKALKKFTLTAKINRFTCDASGTIIPDILVPTSEQKAYPFHLFGEFDRVSGYAISDGVLRELEDTKLFSVYVAGVNTPLFFFSPLNTINSKISKGDLIFIYVDDLNAPTYFHFVIISTNQGGFASLTSIGNVTQIDDTDNWGGFYFEKFKFNWVDDAQMNFPFYNIQTNYKSSFQANPINLELYRFIEQKPEVKALTIAVSMLINQYNGLSGYIAWQNPSLNLSFDIIY